MRHQGCAGNRTVCWMRRPAAERSDLRNWRLARACPRCLAHCGFRSPDAGAEPRSYRLPERPPPANMTVVPKARKCPSRCTPFRLRQSLRVCAGADGRRYICESRASGTAKRPVAALPIARGRLRYGACGSTSGVGIQPEQRCAGGSGRIGIASRTTRTRRGRARAIRPVGQEGRDHAVTDGSTPQAAWPRLDKPKRTHRYGREPCALDVIQPIDGLPRRRGQCSQGHHDHGSDLT
jgi:hypothetical protein